MKIAQIIPITHVDGMGARASLYVQGCPIRCAGCFVAGVPILMYDGTVKPIEAVQVGDRVYTHTGRVHTVTETFIRPYEGPMIKLNFRRRPSNPIICTPEHPFWGVLSRGQDARWIDAEMMTGSYGITPHLRVDEFAPEVIDLAALVSFTEDDTNIWTSADGLLFRVGNAEPLPRRMVVTPELMRLVGYYVAEGHVANRSVCLTFNSNELPAHAEVEQLVRAVFGYEVTTRFRDGRNTAELSFGGMTACAVMASLGGKLAEGKRIHPFIMEQPNAMTWELVKAYFDGDGSWSSSGTVRAETISLQLAWQIWTLLTRRGMHASIRTGYERKIHGMEQKAPVHFVMVPGADWSASDVSLKIRAADYSNLNNIAEFNRVEELEVISLWSGLVYNFEVEGDNSYIVGGIAVHNCQNPHMFDPAGGAEISPSDVYDQLLATGQKALTVLGGEPTEQAQDVGYICNRLKRVGWHIVIYTGRTYEWLLDRAMEAIPTDNAFWYDYLLCQADVLVDGPYVQGLDDDRLQWRGSRNQRVIDLVAMRAAGDLYTIILKPEWDAPTVTIKRGGRVSGAKGLIELLVADTDMTADPARRCGQGKYKESV